MNELLSDASTEFPPDHVLSGGAQTRGPRTFIQQPNFELIDVPTLEVDGLVYFQGDIILGTSEFALWSFGSQGAMDFFNERTPPGARTLWPDNTISYAIDPALPAPERVSTAIQHIESRTNLRFYAMSDDDKRTYFIRFRPGDWCSSYLGAKARGQDLTIADVSSAGNVIHEIAHAAGLWHEHSRQDRDSYIRIRSENVLEGFRDQFEVIVGQSTDAGEYDFASIMHYPAYALALDKSKPTIEALDPPKSFGQRDGLSDLDVLAINTLYPG